MSNNLEPSKDWHFPIEKIKDSVFTFKENLPVFAAFITIVGGMNQFINLLKIDTYYVRFFSLTQLISDGIWIIYLFVPFYIVVFFLLPFLFSTDDYFSFIFNPLDKNGIFRRKRVLFSNLAVTFVYAAMLYVMFIRNWPYSGMLLLLYSVSAFTANRSLSKKYGDEKIFKIFAVIGLLITCISIYNVGYWTFKKNDIPSTLLNNNIVSHIISEKYPKYEHKIRYINDKYIFVQIFCDSISLEQNKILLLPIDKFTEFELLPVEN